MYACSCLFPLFLWNIEVLSSQMLDSLMVSFQSLLLCSAALNGDCQLSSPCFGDWVDFHLGRLVGLSTSQRSPGNPTPTVKTTVTMAVAAVHAFAPVYVSPDNLYQLLDTLYCPRQTSVAMRWPFLQLSQWSCPSYSCSDLGKKRSTFHTESAKHPVTGRKETEDTDGWWKLYLPHQFSSYMQSACFSVFRAVHGASLL